MSRDVTLPTSASERGELQQVQLCVTLAASGHVGWLRVRRSQFVRGENTNKQKKQRQQSRLCLSGLQHLGETAHAVTPGCCSAALQTSPPHTHTHFWPRWRRMSDLWLSGCPVGVRELLNATQTVRHNNN